MKYGRSIIAVLVFSVLIWGTLGCSPEERNVPSEPISGGYLPSAITNISQGGDLDATTLTPRESGELTLEKLEGTWELEGWASRLESGELNNSNAYTVTDKTISLNGQKYECLPKQIDIRPYSPVATLRSEGFGYGSAAFIGDKSNDDNLGIKTTVDALDPYWGNGFICSISGNTLALGFVDANTKVDVLGTICDTEDHPLDECGLSEFDYTARLDGDRLTLSYGEASATYVESSTLSTFGLHHSFWFSEPLNEGTNTLGLIDRTPKDLIGDGYKFAYDLSNMIPSCVVTEEFSVTTPGGTNLMAKLVNPFERTIPAGYAVICWYEYASESSDELKLGSYPQYEFGTTPYSDIYNAYVLPYESSKDYLLYRAGNVSARIKTSIDLTGPDTGERVLKTEHACDIRLEFSDNVLSSVSVSDPVYLTGGLQDNIARDDLDDLTPSVHRAATEKRDEILDELKKSFKAAGIDAAINEATGEVVMDNNVLFSFGSYELGDVGKAYLDKVFAAYASVVLDDKYASVLKNILFEGNTDSDGESEFNMRLSENRANAVMDYCSGLLDDKQRATFDELAICKGYGESNLVYDENGRENKDASRRVAIKFMLKIDGLELEAAAKADGEDSSGASISEPTPEASDNASGTSDAQESSDELSKFRSISDKLSQAWSLYEEFESDGSLHVVLLLLSDDHDYCGYFDLNVDASSIAEGSCTFGEASVEEVDQDTQAITVHHGSGDDRIEVAFNPSGIETMVIVKDPWGGAYGLTALDDADSAVSLFEDVLAE